MSTIKKHNNYIYRQYKYRNDVQNKLHQLMKSQEEKICDHDSHIFKASATPVHMHLSFQSTPALVPVSPSLHPRAHINSGGDTPQDCQILPLPVATFPPPPEHGRSYGRCFSRDDCHLVWWRDIRGTCSSDNSCADDHGQGTCSGQMDQLEDDRKRAREGGREMIIDRREKGESSVWYHIIVHKLHVIKLGEQSLTPYTSQLVEKASTVYTNYK